MFTAAASLALLLWPAASGACNIAPRADGNDTSSGNQTVPEGPWTPSCKLPVDYSVFLSIGHGFKGDRVPATGSMPGYMIFVDFSDAEKAEDETAQSLYDFFMPNASEWFETASNGALSLNITADLSKIYRMPSPAASYDWDSGMTGQQHYQYLLDIMTTYTNNGTLPPPPETQVFYVVPVHSASNFMTRSLTYHGRLYAQYQEKSQFVAMRTVTFGADPFLYWGYSALNHETGHAFGLPDYYPYGDGSTGMYVGGWSAMGDIGGVAPDFFAWDKWRMGWMADDAVDCVLDAGTSEHVLSPLEGNTGTQAVVIAANKTSAVVAEVRVAKGLDSTVCAPGVLIYTVDTTVPTGEGPIRVIDATPDSNGCGKGAWEGVDYKNDGTLTLNGEATSVEVPGFDVTVTVVEQDGDNYKIKVESGGVQAE